MSEILTHREGALGRITLARPRALHALNTAMCEAITATLLDWREDDGIAAILLDHQAGTRGFCAGGDVAMVRRSALEDGGRSGRAFFHAEYRMNHLLFTFPRPIVAFMDGVTMGGGVGLALPCRYRVATENTLFAMPEGAIGLFPDVGAGWYLPRLPGATGKFLALTGARLDGAECQWAGLATHFLPSERLAEVKARIAAALGGHPAGAANARRDAAEAAGSDDAKKGGAEIPRTGPANAFPRNQGAADTARPTFTGTGGENGASLRPLAALSRDRGATAAASPGPVETGDQDRGSTGPAATLSRGLGPATASRPSAAEALVEQVLDALSTAPPPARLAGNAARIDRLFAPERLEDILAALAADPSDWAAKERKAVAAKCPASAKVALRQFAQNPPDFAAEMALEYRLAARMILRSDFAEGVRAVLVDKDNAPRWDPAEPEGVTEAMLDAIFAPLPQEEEWTPHSG